MVFIQTQVSVHLSLTLYSSGDLRVLSSSLPQGASFLMEDADSCLAVFLNKILLYPVLLAAAYRTSAPVILFHVGKPAVMYVARATGQQVTFGRRG